MENQIEEIVNFSPTSKKSRKRKRAGKSALDLESETESEENYKCTEPNQISLNNSSFHQSIKNGNLEEVEMLVRSYPYLKNGTDSKNNSALKTAYECKQYQIIAFLSSEGFTFGPHEDSEKIAEKLPKKRKLRQAESEYLPKPEESLISKLINRSRFSFNPKDKKKYSQQIREYFEELFKTMAFRLILKIVAICDVEIVFDFENASIKGIDPSTLETTAGRCYPLEICKRINIGARRSLEDVLGTLIHELCHLAMYLVYQNKCKPFKTNDINREELFKAILSKYDKAEYKKDNNNNNNIVKRVYQNADHSEDRKIAELIVRAPQMIAVYTNKPLELDALRIRYKDLYKFFDVCNLDMKAFYPSFKERTMIKGFNKQLGIHKKAIDFQWNCKKMPQSIQSESEVMVVKSNVPMFTLKNILNKIGLPQSECDNVILSIEQFVDQKHKGKIIQLTTFNIKPTFYIIQDAEIVGDISSSIASLTKNIVKVVFILNNKTDEKKILKDLKVQITQNIFMWNDLTEVSQNNFLSQDVKFRGVKVKWNQILPLQSKILQKIPLDEILECSEIFNEIQEKKIKTYLMTKIYISRKLISKDDFPVEGDEIMDRADKRKIIIIAQSAGYGKTTTLQHLKYKIQERNSNHLIALIDLKQYAKKFSDYAKLELPFDESLMQILNINKKFDQKLFQQLLNDGKIILMLDGYDEINSDTQKVILKFIEAYCESKTNQLWIATRTHFAEEIEKILKQKSFLLQPFTEENQINFLVKFWQTNNSEKDETELTEIAKELIEKFNKSINCYKSVLRDDKSVLSNFIGIPLQLRMIAEIFKNDIGNVNEILNNFLIDNNKINIFKFYNFFIQKLIIYWNKVKCRIEFEENINQSERNETLLEFHRTQANIEMALGEDEDLCNVVPKLLSEHSIVQFGILHKPEGISDKNYEFVHRTFAEFFYAESVLIEIKKNLNSQEILDALAHSFFKILGEKENVVIRAFINDALTEEFEEIMKSEEFYKAISNAYPKFENCILGYLEIGRIISYLYCEKLSNIYNLFIASKFIDKYVIEEVLISFDICRINDPETLKDFKVLFHKSLHLDEKREILLRQSHVMKTPLLYVFLDNFFCEFEFFDLFWEIYAEICSKEEFYNILTRMKNHSGGRTQFLCNSNIIEIAASYRKATFLNSLVQKLRNYFISNNKSLKIFFVDDFGMLMALSKISSENVEIYWGLFCEVVDDNEKKQKITRTFDGPNYNNYNILFFISWQKDNEVVKFILPKLYDIMGKEIFKEFLITRNNEDSPINAVGQYFRSGYFSKSFFTFIGTKFNETEIRNILIEENTECPGKVISKNILDYRNFNYEVSNTILRAIEDKTARSNDKHAKEPVLYETNTILHFFEAKNYLLKDELKILMGIKVKNGTIFHFVLDYYWSYPIELCDEIWKMHEETFNDEELKEIVLSKNFVILASKCASYFVNRTRFHKCVTALKTWLNIEEIKLMLLEDIEYEEYSQSLDGFELFGEIQNLEHRVKFIELHFKDGMKEVIELLNERICHLKNEDNKRSIIDRKKKK